MRVTNKIMQNNTLYNINQNKIIQDKINTQITTKKKVTRPSDDPVVAIRALRLRSNLNEVSQYYERNIPDAKNWMDLTESSVTTTVDIISNMVDEMRKGSKGTLTPSDRATILESLKQLAEEVYYTGDSDYAGRTIFTGYRTDMKLSFQYSETQNYSITEQLNNEVIDEITYVYTGDLEATNESNYQTGTIEQEVEKFKLNRIRLSYDDLNAGTTPVLEKVVAYDNTGNPITQPAIATPVMTVSKDGAVDPYRMVSDPNYSEYQPDVNVYIPETGEILLCEKAFNDLKNLDPETEITITYDKEEWVKGDLRPEHYFRCETKETNPDGTVSDVIFNESYLTRNGRENKQVIQYDVGFNMSLDVNVTADEVYEHGVTRCVNEVVDLLEQAQQLDEVISNLKNMLNDSKYDHDMVNAKLEAAQKAQTYVSDALQKKFEHGITEMQGYLDDANLALTQVGNRGLRLELVENRLLNQKTSFTELQSKNEDADLAELAVELSSAQLTYNAALAATGKMLSTTLLNYI